MSLIDRCIDWMKDKLKCTYEPEITGTVLTCRNFSNTSGLKVGTFISVNFGVDEDGHYFVLVVYGKCQKISVEFNNLDDLFNYDLTKITKALEML